MLHVGTDHERDGVDYGPEEKSLSTISQTIKITMKIDKKIKKEDSSQNESDN